MKTIKLQNTEDSFHLLESLSDDVIYEIVYENTEYIEVEFESELWAEEVSNMSPFVD